MLNMKMLNKAIKILILPNQKLVRSWCSTPGSVIDYRNNEKDRDSLKNATDLLYRENNLIPCVLGVEEIFTGDEQFKNIPHNHGKTIAKYYYATPYHIMEAITRAMEIKKAWKITSVKERANIWRKCADIINGESRHLLNASIILGQSKTYLDADRDTTQLIESLRNSADALEKSSNSEFKISSNSLTPSQYLRPLDGFVAAVGPFNMNSLSCELAFIPALMGNCVLWKPSNNCVLANYLTLKTIHKAGLPEGIITFIPANEKLFMETIVKCASFSGINFAGKMDTLRSITKMVGFNMHTFQNFPRIVGECGGKNYHFVHESADVNLVVTETIAAAFQYSGQNCVSCSRLYVPESLWEQISCCLQHAISLIKTGDACDFSCFTSAVIDEAAFNRIVRYLLYAGANNSTVEVICGGDFNKSFGYFIEPTVVHCKNPFDCLMIHEILGPVLSVYVYENNKLDETLSIINESSPFALTGSIFAKDDDIICKALESLRMSAGNIFINNKCSGSKRSLEMYSGNRLSGTKDKVGYNRILRWSSPQLIQKRNYAIKFSDN